MQPVVVKGVVVIFGIVLLLPWMPSEARGEPNFWAQRCASCHGDDTTSCDGCHRHRGNLNAVADQIEYAPGDPVTITFDGGQQFGWIRALLYDADNVEIDRATGPSGTGDDGAGDPVTFPVSLAGTAPLEPGDYTWEAAWYGNSNNGGSAHGEVRTQVVITVTDIVGVPDEDGGDDGGETATSWARVKSFYR